MFQFTLIKNQIRRYIPVGAVNLFLFFLHGMYPLIRLISNGFVTDSEFTDGLVQNLLVNGQSLFSLRLIFLQALATAMCVFSYKFRKKETGFMHALPISRGTLYTGSLASAVILLYLPLLANSAAMAALLCAVGKAACLKYVGFDLLLTGCCVMIALAVAVLCCHISSSLVAVPFLFVILNSLAYSIEKADRYLLITFLYGVDLENALPYYTDIYGITSSSMYPGIYFAQSETSRIAPWKMLWLSPLQKFSDGNVLYRNLYAWQAGSGQYKDLYLQKPSVLTIDWKVYGLYFAAGLLLLAAVYLLYRKYRAERTGRILLFAPVRWLLSACLAFLLSVSVIKGVLFLYPGVSLQRLLFMCLLTLCISAVAFLLLTLLFSGKRRLLRKAGKPFAVYAVVVIAFLCLLEADPLGVEAKVPAADQIEGIYAGDEVSHDRQLIEKQRRLHQAIAEAVETLEPLDQDSYVGISYLLDLVKNQKVTPEDITSYMDIKLTYVLKNGKKLYRSYRLPEIALDGTLKSLYDDLTCDPEYLICQTLGEDFDASQVRKCSLYSEETGGNYFGEEAQELVKLLLQDVRENDAWKEAQSGKQEASDVLCLSAYISTKEKEYDLSGFSKSKPPKLMLEKLRSLDYDVDTLLQEFPYSVDTDPDIIDDSL